VSKATTCKVCGAPRYELSEYRLCFTHYSEYRSKVSRAAYERTHEGARVYTFEGAAYSDKRRHQLARTCARFGIQPGRVWKAVLGE
jgi:hypothetical protein